jgi:hypothetical protein
MTRVGLVWCVRQGEGDAGGWEFRYGQVREQGEEGLGWGDGWMVGGIVTLGLVWEWVGSEVLSPTTSSEQHTNHTTLSLIYQPFHLLSPSHPSITTSTLTLSSSLLNSHHIPLDPH